MLASDWSPTEDFWRHRHVAVTGATGFLGSHLVGQLLALGANVAVLVRDQVPVGPVARPWMDRVRIVHGAAEDQEGCERLLGEYESITVFHLAAQSQVQVANQNPRSTLVSNIAGTWSLLEACRRSPNVAQVVVASSDKAYGDQVELPYFEDTPLAAINPYDVSKACADMIARSYGRTFGLPVAVTRCGNIFGPGDLNWRRIVPGIVRDVLDERRPVIRSDGSPTRDYIYVTDVVYAYLQLVEKLAANPDLNGHAFNFSAESPLSVLELVGLIQDVAGTALEPDIQGRATGEISHQTLSAAKARDLLGWRPLHTLEDALRATVAWYRHYLQSDSI